VCFKSKVFQLHYLFQGLNIVPYLSSPEGESYEQPTSEDLVFTCKWNQA